MIKRHEAEKALETIITDEKTLKQLLSVFFERSDNFLEALFEATRAIELSDVMGVLDALFF